MASSSSSTPSATRRFKQVHVDIPFSPLHRRPSTSGSTPTAKLGASNASMKILSVDIPPSPLHRRPSVSTSLSKAFLKENVTTKRKAEDQLQEVSKKPRPCEDTADLVRCHQCSRKCDAAACIQCSFTPTQASSTSKRCQLNYCKACVKNRYSQDIDTLKTSVNLSTNEAYTFKCFRCQDICNCRACRKAKGLSPLGNLTDAHRKDTTKPSTGIPAKTKPVVQPTTKPQVKPAVETTKKKTLEQRTLDPTVKAVAKTKIVGPATKKVAKPKPIPKLKWTRIPTSLSLADTEDRILIREFVVRFAPETGLSKALLEELAYVAGEGREKGNKPLVNWVSESCVKTILIWLLEVVLDDREHDAHAKKALKTTIQQLRASTGNLCKMWSALSILKDTTPTIITIAEPLPCPGNVVIRSTRSLEEPSPTNYIATSAQLVPVVASIVGEVLRLEVVRKELEDGLQRYKEYAREKQEGAKLENDRWEIVKTAQPPAADLATQRDSHKQVLEELDHALKVAAHDCSIRSGALGIDHEGRTYWALTPGVLDREYAKSILASRSTGNRKAKRGKGRKAWKKGDDDELPDWSSIVAIWGRKPPDAVTTGQDSDDTEEDVERWWMFTESEEVLKLADWLAAMEESRDGPTRMKGLINDLRNHGAILKWKTSLAEI